jgi:hypothetical protein
MDANTMALQAQMLLQNPNLQQQPQQAQQPPLAPVIIPAPEPIPAVTTPPYQPQTQVPETPVQNPVAPVATGSPAEAGGQNGISSASFPFLEKLKKDPHITQSLLMMGIRMMQGEQRGQNGLGLLGDALAVGAATYEGARTKKKQEVQGDIVFAEGRQTHGQNMKKGELSIEQAQGAIQDANITRPAKMVQAEADAATAALKISNQVLDAKIYDATKSAELLVKGTPEWAKNQQKLENLKLKKQQVEIANVQSQISTRERAETRLQEAYNGATKGTGGTANSAMERKIAMINADPDIPQEEKNRQIQLILLGTPGAKYINTDPFQAAIAKRQTDTGGLESHNDSVRALIQNPMYRAMYDANPTAYLLPPEQGAPAPNAPTTAAPVKTTRSLDTAADQMVLAWRAKNGKDKYVIPAGTTTKNLAEKIYAEYLAEYNKDPKGNQHPPEVSVIVEALRRQGKKPQGEK